MRKTATELANLPLTAEQRGEMLARLTDAVDDYRCRRPRNIALVRKELSAISSASKKLRSVFEDLSPETLAVFSTIYGAPRGKASQQLSKIHQAADEALDGIKEQKHKESNAERVVLACHVALQLQSSGIPVSMTRPSELINRANGGAAYACLLHAVLADAGIDPPIDLRPIMKAGRALSQNPRGDLYP